MAPKRKTEDEYMQQVFCYYCLLRYPDLKALQDHQKSKHLQCQHCRKKMDSLGGLKVHSESVHKIKLETVQNAIPERASADGPETFLMEGVPEDEVQAFYDQLKNEYWQEHYEHRKRTGNPIKGSVEAQNMAKRVKITVTETREEKKARIEALKAKRAAEKAAQANGDAAVKQEPSDNFAAQDPYVKLEQNDPYVKPEQTSSPYVTQPFNGYNTGYATSPPMGGFGGAPMTQPQQAYGYPTGPQYGYSPPNYGQPTSFQPPYSNSPLPQQPVGYGYGGSPQGFPQQPIPMSSHSPNAYTPPVAVKNEPGVGMNGKSAMPAAPAGLPQRPSFNAPKYSKEDMEKFHHLPPKAAAGPSNDAPASDVISSSSAPNHSQFGRAIGPDGNPTEANIVRDLGILPSTDDQNTEAENEAGFTGVLDAEVDEANISILPVPATDATTTKVKDKEKRVDATAAKAKNTLFKVNDNIISPEEKKGKQAKYTRHASKANKKRRATLFDDTVLEQADSQAVTGSVADDLEQ